MTPDLLEYKAKRSGAGHSEPLLTHQLDLGERGLAVNATHERFWSKVRVLGPTDCWIWTSVRQSKGYGTFSVGGRAGGMVLAHRFAVSLQVEIPEGAHVLHECDNPPCVNPAHLRVGTRSENMRDMAIKLRHGQSKLDPQSVREIRTAAANGVSQRQIARRYSVSQTAVRFVLSGKTWSHVA